VEIAPGGQGRLTLRFPPIPALSPSAGLVSLSAPPLELEIAPGSGSAAQAAPKEGGKELAGLYSALRRAPPFSDAARKARKAALARAAELGLPPPMSDALPPPGFFEWPAAVAAAAALGFLASWAAGSRKRRGSGSPPRGGQRRGGRGFASAALLALALTLGALGLASASERREALAVVWTDSLLVVPSPQSELRVAVTRGSTARARGFSGAYASVVLEDGTEGWTARDSLYFY
jgi:hypothetical protein